MKSRGHAHRTHVGRSVRTGPHLVHFRQIGDFSEVRNPAGMNHRRADVIDELFLNQLLAIKNGIKNFPYGQGGSGVAANEPKAFLQFSGRGVLKPKKMKWFKTLSQSRGFDWS